MYGRNRNKHYITEQDISDEMPAFMDKLKNGELNPGSPAPTYIEGPDLVMEFKSAEEAFDFYIALTLYMGIQQRKADMETTANYGGSLLN